MEMEKERQQQQPNLGGEEEPGREENEDPKAKQAREEWETMARLWLSAFPEARAVSTAEVETWIDSNLSSLPPDLQSMPRIDLIDRLLSIQNHMRLPIPAATASTTTERVGGESSLHQNPYYQFQRTEQWQPVYTWLESLATDEVVKSKDIADWLTANPEFRDQVLLRHSKYHLMHYIKKCHVKMLRRKERKKVASNDFVLYFISDLKSYKLQFFSGYFC